jgi:predicted heme/steroid binding protein
MGGPDLTGYGRAFQRGKYQYPIPAEAFQEFPFHKRIVRFAIRYIHFITGILWFGTIFFVHIFIKPQTLTEGLPKSQLMLGWACIIIMAVTGTLLSIARISSLSQLYTTRFGIILSAKVILFLMMVCIATVTTCVIQKRLKQQAKQRKTDADHQEGFMTHTELLSFNGAEQRPTYIAVGREVYDVSESPAWEGGRHMGQHFSGRDLTDGLSDAPHGPEVLSRFKKVGRLWKGKMASQHQPLGVKIMFLFLSHSALVISFLIILCVALWRW